PAALELFDKINETAVQTPEIQLLRATLLNSAGRPADARAIASGIAAKNPNNIDALLVLAASASLEGKEREQRNFLERVIKIDPKNLKAISDLGYIALRAQSLRTAAGHFDKALAIDGDYREALVGRAIVYRYAHNPKESEKLLNKAIRQNPGWATPLNERARLYKGAGFPEDALRDLKEAKKIDPASYWISVDRAAALIDLDRKKEALEELDRAVSLSGGNFLAYVYRAGIRDEFGDYRGAEQDYAVLMKIKPDYYFAAEGFGIIKMRNGQYTEARDAFLAAYKQAPKEYRYALLAAVNWMKAGKMGDPKQFLAQVLKTAPRDSADWHILKLYHDLSGDSDTVAKAGQEQNLDAKARMLFYLAYYYDIRGNKTLGNNFFLQVKEMDRKNMIEWKINEMILDERGINNL
ncbi:MAG: tetratricopeptide repeat protein, partial [Treponema sp.]|nr:tetratricopeptide repeat protein [Treponema sp.]